MDSHPIENLMRTTMESIKEMIDVNTIVGDPVESIDGTTIIPISRVCVGFASGGSEFNNIKPSVSSDNYPFGGGSGAGVTVRPVAFLVVKNDSIRLLSVDQQNTYDRIVDTVPQVIDIIKTMFKDKGDKHTQYEESEKCDE